MTLETQTARLDVSHSVTGEPTSEIPGLLEDLANLSESDLTPREFFVEVIGRVSAKLPSSGCLLWDRTDAKSLTLLLHHGCDEDFVNQISSDVSHRRLVDSVIQLRRCRLVAPRFIDHAAQVANTTDHPILFAPVTAGSEVEYLLESFIDDSVSQNEQQDMLATWEIISGLLCNYVRSQKLQRQSKQLRWQNAATAFRNRVSQSLDPLVTAMSVANESRNLIQCDRVSVVRSKRGRFELISASGQAELNRRSNSIRLLEKLAQRVLKTGQRFEWSVDDSQPLAPQIEEPLQEYIDHSLANRIVIHPLRIPNSVENADVSSSEAVEDCRASCGLWSSGGESNLDRPIFGAIVVEHFSGQSDDNSEQADRRASSLLPTIEISLHNATRHHQVFLLPVWSAIGKTWHAIGLKRSVAILTVLVALIFAACFIQADFQISVDGELQPLLRRQVFASSDGIVKQVRAKHGKKIRAGEPLVILENLPGENELLMVLSEMNTAEKKLASIKAARIAGQVGPNRDHEYAIEEESLAVSISNLQMQHELLVESQADLILASKIDGEVLTWNVNELLDNRPVQRGQALLTVADTEGPWVLRLPVPDRRMGHLLAAQSKVGNELPVEFILATEPDVRLNGTVQSISGATSATPDNDQTVEVVVAIDRESVSTLRPGAVASAKIFAGRRTVGYVWLQDTLDYVQSRILFRLW